jgi:hypothetical protein
MSEPPNEEKLVYITGHSTPALQDPRFIVYADGKYYVTFGAWEYDEYTTRLKLTAEQLEDIRRVKAAFDKGGEQYTAVKVEDRASFGGGHTAPLPTPTPTPPPHG